MAKRIVRGLIVLAAALTATTARAETFVIQAGSSLGLDFEGDLFRFQGKDFSVFTLPNETGEFGPFFTEPATSLRCDPCSAGDLFDPSFRTNGEIFLGLGNATFGSQTYTRANLVGTLDFDVTPLVFPNSTSEGFEVSTPFTFRGTVRGLNGNVQLFAADFTGAGNVGRFFDRGDDGRYAAGENRITFLFNSAAAPVPEPATLLLLGSTAGGLLARARSRVQGRPL